MSFLLRRRLAGAMLFLLPRYDYWHPYLAPRLDGSANGTGAYYLDFSAKCSHPGPFDPAGIPYTHYGGAVGLQQYPIDICQYALGHHAQWLATRQPRHRDIFLTQARWLSSKLRNRSDRAGGPGLWLAEFDWGRLRAPWPSAMAQGQGISVMTRAYALTGDQSYLRAATSAFAGLRVSVAEGGVVRYDGTLPFFEELPIPEPSRILNGAIFALWGVYDLLHVTQDPKIRRYYEAALLNLQLFLPQYDLGFWTRYDLEETGRPHISSAFYQELHVNQLAVMHHLTKLECFERFALRWKRQLESMPNRWRALAAKVLS